MAPVLRHESDLTGSQVWQGDARRVAANLPDDCASLAILDGPYGMHKAAWDRLTVDELPEWYRPHLQDVDRLLAPSASLYFWNTAAGWAAVHPLLLSMGWTFRTLIVWSKVGANPARLTASKSSKWPTTSEFCGFYGRGSPFHQNPTGADNVWQFDPSNGMRSWERLWSGNIISRPGKIGGYYQNPEPLHPCQKPIVFSERMIRASSRPGDTIWAPFGGTIREAVAAERIARADAADARRVMTAALSLDGGADWGPVSEQVQGMGTRRVDPRQVQLFNAGG